MPVGIMLQTRRLILLIISTRLELIAHASNESGEMILSNEERKKKQTDYYPEIACIMSLTPLLPAMAKVQAKLME